MSDAFLSTAWFFLPTFVANQCPGFAWNLNLPLAKMPVWEKRLGPRKTWGAYYAGPLGALVVLLFQRQFPEINGKLGLFDYDGKIGIAVLALGLCPIFGDHIKSLIKRLPPWKKAPGTHWWPWDQTDFAIATIAASAVLLTWIGWQRATIIIALVLVYHPIGNEIAYRLGWRDTR